LETVNLNDLTCRDVPTNASHEQVEAIKRHNLVVQQLKNLEREEPKTGMSLPAKFFLLVAGVGVAGALWALMNGWTGAALDACWVIGVGLGGFLVFWRRK
jgi:hypothetical protein